MWIVVRFKEQIQNSNLMYQKLCYFFLLLLIVSCQNEPVRMADLEALPTEQADSIKSEIQRNFTFRLTDYETIEGSDYVLFEVSDMTREEAKKLKTMGQEGVYGGYSDRGYGVSIWNLLFYNTQTKDYHAIFYLSMLMFF